MAIISTTKIYSLIYTDTNKSQYKSKMFREDEVQQFNDSLCNGIRINEEPFDSVGEIIGHFINHNVSRLLDGIRRPS